MRYALLVAVLAPAVAGAAALLWRDRAGAMGPSLAPRALGSGGIVASIAGAGWIIWEAGRTASIPVDGLHGDAWRGMLVVCVALATGAWLVRRREVVDVLAARLALTTSVIGSIVAADGATAAAFLGVSSTCVVWMRIRGHVSPTAAGMIISTDVVLIAAMFLRVGGGLGTPMQIDGWVTWVWGAALLARVWSWSEHRDEPGLVLVYRLQAFWFAGWLLESDALTALGLAAALGAATAARRATRNGSGVALGMAFAMLTVVSASLRDAELASATALLAVATVTTGVLCALGRPQGALSGLVPAGAALPGIAVLTAVVLRADDLSGRAIAIGVGVAACYAAVAVGTSLLGARTRARAAWVWVPLAAGALIAAWPRLLVDAVAPALSGASGTSLVPFDTGMPTWFVAAAAGALVVVAFAARRGHTAPDDAAAVVDGPLEIAAGWSVSGGATLLAGGSLMLAVAVLVRAITRGFL